MNTALDRVWLWQELLAPLVLALATHRLLDPPHTQMEQCVLFLVLIYSQKPLEPVVISMHQCLYSSLFLYSILRWQYHNTIATLNLNLVSLNQSSPV